MFENSVKASICITFDWPLRHYHPLLALPVSFVFLSNTILQESLTTVQDSSALSYANILWWPDIVNNMDPYQNAPLGKLGAV